MADWQYNDPSGDFNAEDEVRRLEQQYGISRNPNDVADIARRNPEDRAQVLADYEAQYRRRQGSQTQGSGTDSTILSNGNGQVQRPHGSSSPTQAWNSQPSNPAGGEFMRLLMERATQGTRVSSEDPNIRAQVAPYAAQEERVRRNYVSDVAERYGPLANIQGEERMAAERAGQRTGMFEGELIGREIEARRMEIAQALSLWGAQLSGEQRLALERELAYLNDQARTSDRNLTRYGMDQGNDQFLRELALREWMAGEDNDYRWSTV